MEMPNARETLPARIAPTSQFYTDEKEVDLLRAPVLDALEQEQIICQNFSETNPLHPVSSVYGRLQVMFFVRRYKYIQYADFLIELIRRLKGEGNKRWFILAVPRLGNQFSHKEKEEYERCIQEEVKRLCKAVEATGNVFKWFWIDSTYTPSLWARDGFWARMQPPSDETVQLHLVGPKSGTSSTQALTTSLKEQLQKWEEDRMPAWELDQCQAPRNFEGGNMLVADDFILMGKRGLGRIKPSTLEKFWGKPVILLTENLADFHNRWATGEATSRIRGDGYQSVYSFTHRYQPIYHLDLFITLAGKDEDGKEVFVIGKPVLGFDMDQAPCDVKKDIRDILTNSQCGIQKFIQQLEDRLCDLGIPYRIKRNELPLIYHDVHEDEARACGKQKKRHFLWASHNNALVEHYKEGTKTIRRVVLPTYGMDSDYSAGTCGCTGHSYGNWTDLRQYDESNKQLWEQLGFEVIQLKKAFHAFLQDTGSLNCLTNVIDRYTKAVNQAPEPYERQPDTN